jgi:transcriptional regulator with XRE-family HTH domain
MDDVGDRLRKVREMHGLSQRKLAKLSGISNATISQVEHGKSNISLGVLKQILEAIPMSISEFFTLEFSSIDKVFYTSDELVETGTGDISYRQVGTNLSKHKLQMLIERYPAGADTGRSMFKHEGEEAGIIMEGIVEFTVGDKTKILRPGDAYLFDSRLPHRVRNVGKKDCVFISACTPPSF